MRGRILPPSVNEWFFWQEKPIQWPLLFLRASFMRIVMSGTENGWVFNGPNRLYAGKGKKEKVDEIRHEEEVNSPYILD